MKIPLLISIILLSGCATTVNNETTNAQAKTQCPIGYHLVKASGKVIFASGMDKNKHVVEFRCVVDKPKDTDKKYGVSR